MIAYHVTDTAPGADGSFDPVVGTLGASWLVAVPCLDADLVNGSG